LPDLIVPILAFILVLLVAGNNLAVCVGPVVSSRIINRRTGIILAIIGSALGVVLQGSILRFGIDQLLPTSQPLLLPITLSIAIAIFLAAHRLRVPQPLSITFTMALLGIDLAYGSGINVGFALLIIFSWILATLGSLTLSYFSMGVLEKVIKKRRVWQTLDIMKGMLIILSFLAAFTFGANTIGLIYASLPPGGVSLAIVIVAIILGSVLLSAGTLRRIGDEILPLRYANALVSQFIAVVFVESATLFSIPLSSTQALTSSIYGTGLSYKARLLVQKPLKRIISIWVITAAISFAAGYIATYLIFLMA